MPHPLDVDYVSLKAKLEHVKTSENDYKIIEKNLKATMPSYQKLEIIDVWRVDREGEVHHTCNSYSMGQRDISHEGCGRECDVTRGGAEGYY